MNSLHAVGIAECAERADDDAACYAAWRRLIDTGLAWTRETFFGRTAPAPIASGDGYNPACEDTKARAGAVPTPGD
jgi:hypothetical protein